MGSFFVAWAVCFWTQLSGLVRGVLWGGVTLSRSARQLRRRWNRRLSVEQFGARVMLDAAMLEDAVVPDANHFADVDRDGFVSPIDAVIVANVVRHEAGGVTDNSAAPHENFAADVHRDGRLTAEDFDEVARHVAALQTLQHSELTFMANRVPMFAEPEGEDMGCVAENGCFDIGVGMGGTETDGSETGNSDWGNSDSGGMDLQGDGISDTGTLGGDDGHSESGCWPSKEDPDCFDIGNADGGEVSGTSDSGADTAGLDTDGSDIDGSDIDGSETTGHDLAGNEIVGTEGGQGAGEGGMTSDAGNGDCFPMNENPDCWDLVGGATSDEGDGHDVGPGGGTEPPCEPLNEDWDCIDTGGESSGDDFGSDTAGNEVSGPDNPGDGDSGADTFGDDASNSDTTGSDTVGSNTVGADTLGGELTGDETSGSNISGADLTGNDVVGTELSGSDTSGSDLSGADTLGADTSGADTVGANTSGPDTSGADNSGSDNSGSDNSGSDNSGADNSGSDLSGEEITGADTVGEDISGEDTSGVETVGADISGVDLSGADTTGVDTAGEEVAGADTSGNGTSGNEVTGADITGADISGADISGADISGADTTGEDTSGQDMVGADTTGNDTTGNEVSGSDNTGSDMTGTDGADDDGNGPCSGMETNDPPVASHDPPQDNDPATPQPDTEFMLGHDEYLEVPASGVLMNDVDSTICGPLSAILVNNPSHGRVTLKADGSFRYEPDANFAGHDTFTYVASDGDLQSNIATVYLRVVNGLPTAVDDDYSAVYATTLTVDAESGVLANDSDPENDVLQAVLITGPKFGSLTLNDDGSFTYQPLQSFAGDDTFTYQADDGMGRSNSATATIHVRRPEPDVDTDSDNSGSVDRTPDEDHVEVDAPGNILRLNFDDDNVNCTTDTSDAPFVDNNGNPMEDDDLEPVDLSIDSADIDINGFKLTLSTSGSIALWATADKKKLPKTSFVIGTDEIPSRIFVEGYGSGTAQIHWTLFNPQGILVSRDVVRFSVIDVKLNAYRPQTEGVGYGRPFKRWRIPDEQMDRVGIRRNGDDDDSDGLPDGTQLNPVPGENDTIEFDIESFFGTAEGIEIVMRRSNTNISVWSGSDRSGPMLTGDPDAAVLTGTSGWIDWYDATPNPTATFQIEVRDKVSGNRAFVADAMTIVPFKSVVVIFDGEFQDFADPPKKAGEGIVQFAIAEYQNSGYDVHAFEESDYVTFDIRTGPAWREVANAINNRGVTEVAIMGYSHGGGDTYLLAAALAGGTGIVKPFTVPMTGYIDAITQPFGNTFGELRRPPLSLFHVNQYQTQGLIHSGPSNGDDDINRDTLNVSHTTIDDHIDVLYLLQQRLYQRVNR